MEEKQGQDKKLEEEEDDGRETRCGVLGWRPQCLQGLANIQSFTAAIGLVNIFSSMNFSYYSAVTTQIERQFGLSSSTTGFLKNVDNIGFLTSVLFVTHFCRYTNKPRLFTGALCIVSMAVAMFALPHFIYGTRNINLNNPSNVTVNEMTNTSTHYAGLCRQGLVPKTDEETCRSRPSFGALNVGALVIFFLSEFIQGMAATPKGTLSITYMDDNAGKNSPIYFSFLFATRAISPILGFLLGAWAMSKYVDLSVPKDISPRDPNWIGAWWIGYLVCGGLTLIAALPLVCFPPYFKGAKRSLAEVQDKAAPGGVFDKLKDLPKALLRLGKNKVYLLATLGIMVEVNMAGFAAFMPKYVQTHFRASPSTASIIVGAVTASAFLIGPVISGRITARVNPTPHSILRLAAILTVVSIGGYVSLMFLGCDNNDYVGGYLGERLNLTTDCNSGCFCDDQHFSPVCGKDLRTYFSPCHAGCVSTATSNVTSTTVYENCKCVPGGIASPGECPSNCKMLIPYAVVMGITFLAGSMVMVPMMTTFMRAVDHRDKALSIGAASFLISSAAFPAPIYFGFLVDSTCLVQQSSCTRKGACLLYDQDAFRWRMHGYAAGVKALACLIYVVGYFISRRAALKKENKKEATGEELLNLNTQN